MEENILQEADRITQGDRRQAYGSVKEDFTRISGMWSALLANKLKAPITAHEYTLMMILMKVSRSWYSEGRDSLVDIAGFARTGEMLAEDSKPKLLDPIDEPDTSLQDQYEQMVGDLKERVNKSIYAETPPLDHSFAALDSKLEECLTEERPAEPKMVPKQYMPEDHAQPDLERFGLAAPVSDRDNEIYLAATERMKKYGNVPGGFVGFGACLTEEVRLYAETGHTSLEMVPEGEQKMFNLPDLPDATRLHNLPVSRYEPDSKDYDLNIPEEQDEYLRAFGVLDENIQAWRDSSTAPYMQNISQNPVYSAEVGQKGTISTAHSERVAMQIALRASHLNPFGGEVRKQLLDDDRQEFYDIITIRGRRLLMPRAIRQEASQQDQSAYIKLMYHLAGKPRVEMLFQACKKSNMNNTPSLFLNQHLWIEAQFFRSQFFKSWTPEPDQKDKELIHKAVLSVLGKTLCRELENIGLEPSQDLLRALMDRVLEMPMWNNPQCGDGKCPGCQRCTCHKCADWHDKVCEVLKLEKDIYADIPAPKLTNVTKVEKGFDQSYKGICEPGCEASFIEHLEGVNDKRRRWDG